jgi:hypothetical protein
MLSFPSPLLPKMSIEHTSTSSPTDQQTSPMTQDKRIRIWGRSTHETDSTVHSGGIMVKTMAVKENLQFCGL